MRVLFTTLREKSHFLGLLPFLEAFQRQGHEIAVSAPPDFAERVAPTGATFLPFGHPGDEGLKHIWARFRTTNPEDLRRVAVGELFAGACAGAAIPRLLEIVEEWKPAVVVRESLEFAAFVAAEKLGVPHVRVAICARGAEEENNSLAATWVDEHLRNAGLPADPSGERLRRELAITMFPPSFDPAEAEPDPFLSYRAPRRSAPPLPDWWEGRQEPFVYVTLGTVTGKVDILQGPYRDALDALAGLPVRALLTIGSALPLEALGEIPPNVHVERFVPQDDVLPHAAAVLCHGGSGTTIGALAAGVPAVVTPIFADQPHNAARITAIGAGIGMPMRISVEALRGALSRVLEEASFRSAAEKIAREIAALPSIDEAAGDVARLTRELGLADARA
jgi:UDP:flavonoid glycosyltransferase YjiC (YdhE family)